MLSGNHNFPFLRIGILSIEDRNIPDLSHLFTQGSRGDLIGQRILLVFPIDEFYLDKFVGLQLAVDGLYQTIYNTFFPHPDRGVQVMSQSSQIFFLGGAQHVTLWDRSDRQN